jgi:diguanylate cyclase (GGDEF)-like protein
VGDTDQRSRLDLRRITLGFLAEFDWGLAPCASGRTDSVMAGRDAVDQDELLIRERLRSLDILKGVDEGAAWAVLQHCLTRQLVAGEVLLTKGQPNHYIYFLLEGRLGIHLDEPPSEPIAYLEQGQVVGEISVIDSSPVSAHVTVIERALLLEADDESFWRLANASHQFAVNLLLLLAQRMRSNNSSLYRATLMQRELERDATVDALTGMYNRRWWEEKCQRIVARAQRSQQPMALLVIDVDHFKRYNDTFGHISGDLVLRAVARTMAKNLRPTDVAARFGGEEFVVALPSTELSGARVAAERVRQAVAESQIVDASGESLPGVTISIGLSTLRADESATSWFGRADAALYRAKRAGRNRVASDD